MKLALKIALGFMLPLVMLIAVNAMIRVDREMELFDLETWRDHRTLGNAVNTAVTDLWDEGGEQAAREGLAHIASGQRHVNISWIAPDGYGLAAPLTEEEQRTLRAGNPVTRRSEDPTDGLRRTSLWPVVIDGKRTGLIRLDELSFVEGEYLMTTVMHTTVFSMAALLLGSLGAASVGFVLVGGRVRRLVVRARRVAGGDFTPQARGRAFHDELGELEGELVTMTAALADQNSKLHDEMTSRITLLEQLRHADRLVAVGRLAAGVAHELGSPLNVVIGRARLIADAEVSGDEAVKNAAVVVKEANRMTATIRKLLDFARQHRSAKALVPITEIVRRAADLVSSLARGRDVAITVDAAPASPVLAVDGEQIEQMLVNLGVNAIQAMPTGGHLKFSVVSPSQAPARKANGQTWLCIAVEDDGVGMPAETLAHIFEPFFTTKDVGEGTGLGLSVVHGIVEEHGGAIEVESEPGRGTTFRVYLPHGATPS